MEIVLQTIFVFLLITEEACHFMCRFGQGKLIIRVGVYGLDMGIMKGHVQHSIKCMGKKCFIIDFK